MNLQGQGAFLWMGKGTKQRTWFLLGLGCRVPSSLFSSKHSGPVESQLIFPLEGFLTSVAVSAIL